jgi:N-acetylneuraminic acid mutarotase
MKPTACLIIIFSLACFALAAEPVLPPLPEPVTDNAVASLKSHGHVTLFSLMGVGSTKAWDAITNTAYVLEPGAEKWSPLHPVPGSVGRIAAAAVGARDHIFLFGGYVVDSRNRGRVVPDVNVYEPLSRRWARGEDIPVPVGDSVIGVYRDRYIYLVGGRSNDGVVPNVQVYDGQKNKWAQGTPIPGSPVFGHAGTLVDDTIVFVDGAYKNPANSPLFVPSDECWMGKINHHDPTKIEWSKLPSHPGAARYRISAGGSEKDHKIYFAGGAANPYDSLGHGFDGKPSEPSPTAFAFNLRSGKWEVISEQMPNPIMDQPGMLLTHVGLVVLGGMEKGQQVTSKVTVLPDRSTAH